MDALIDPAVQEVVKLGVVFTMFLVITYVLCKAVKTLYDRNQAMADTFVSALQKNTEAINSLANKIEEQR
jgi:uncharacterized membrane protein